MVHAAQAPTAGALHDAAVSTFFDAFFFGFSEALAGTHINRPARTATAYDIVIGCLLCN
jgi:hypothetical protein